MKTGVPELLFQSRRDFREWLSENSGSSGGVWLIFGKTKAVLTVSAAEALEEALCFGWIDGQMKSVDSTRYIKYFSRRRDKSVWSEKNKKIVEALREKKLMAAPGEKAVETAKKNGTWALPKREAVSAGQVKEFAKNLAGISPAYENFQKMPASVQAVYTGRYLSFKTEEARQRDFKKIVDRLNNNLKPM